jgi:hypothetical protein
MEQHEQMNDRKNVDKFIIKVNSCPLCNSKKKIVTKSAYRNRYSEQFSNLMKISEKELIDKIQNVRCKKCNLIYKSFYFKKNFYQNLLNKIAPVHPRGWETISGRFSKKNLNKEIQILLNKIKLKNSKNKEKSKRATYSIVDSIKTNSYIEDRSKKNYLKAINQENISYITRNKSKIISLLDAPERFKRFTNFSDDNLFRYIQKYLHDIKFYGEIGCPLWGMLKVAKNNGCKTTFIKGDESFFWGKKCKKKKVHCFLKIDKTTNLVKRGIDFYKGKKIDFLGVFQYLDHDYQPKKLLKKIFSISKSAGFIFEDEDINLITSKKTQKGDTGIPAQHFTGWNKKAMMFVAKKFKKKLKTDFSDIKISGHNFYLLY